MKLRLSPLVAISLLLGLLSSHASDIDLAGKWKLALDPNDQGLSAGPESWNFSDSIELPNTTAKAGKGEAATITPALKDPWVRNLHQKTPYLGPAWYQKEVAIPADWAGQDVILTLERVLWESRVWVNDQPVGKPQESVSVPHRHDLTEFIKPGQTNTITLRIDNRQIYNIALSHAHTKETQSTWNGAVGKLTLTAVPKLRITHLKIRPQLKSNSLDVTVETENNTGKAGKVPIQFFLDDDSNALFQTPAQNIPKGIASSNFTIKLKSPNQLTRWSEFNPKTHTLKAELKTTAPNLSYSTDFGYRNFIAQGERLFINGKPTFLRGNLECCIFPKTGHPDMDGPEWEKIIKTSKEWGINHIRFHSWCPPEIAFQLADQYGMYLQIELPNWSFKMGQTPDVDQFFMREGFRIFREYGNHPSFVMFALGNELTGDYSEMDEMLKKFKKEEPELLYTSTAFSFSKRGKTPGPEDDFFISQQTTTGWIRGQGFLNTQFPTTMTDYSAGAKSIKIPLVTHEVGQYHVFPDLRELEKYGDSPLRPTSWEAIRNDLEAKGRLEYAQTYTRDSAKLASILYKEDIERALRTPGISGIQLLQLQDFPGQGTATVGLLDSFWDNKGGTTAAEFSTFCAPTTPLVQMEKFVWQNTETFEASITAAHFGEDKLEDIKPEWQLLDGTKEVSAGTLPAQDITLGSQENLGSIKVNLADVSTAKKLKLVVKLGEHENDWPIWVYPKQDSNQTEADNFVIHKQINEETYEDLAAGKRVLLLPPANVIRKPLPARFIPVFWSPVHFNGQAGSIGSTILSEHPVWKDFPTDTHTDWQWWELTADSIAVDLDGIAGIEQKRDIPFAFIDKFNRNALPAAIFEAKVGPGKLLVCTLDVDSDLDDRIVARQLRRSLINYVSGKDFTPKAELSPDQIDQLFAEADLFASSDSAHPNHPADAAIDNNPETFWHTDWREKNGSLPAKIDLDLVRKRLLKGFSYLPRQDMARGHIKTYSIQVSLDGKKWNTVGDRVRTFPKGTSKVEVDFKNPVAARYMRFKILTEQQGNTFANCAELKPIEVPEADVEQLGIIPGFND